MIRAISLYIFNIIIQMFSISNEEMEEGIDLPMSAAGLHRQALQPPSNQSNQKAQTQNALGSQASKVENKEEDQVKGCTRFCKLNFYRPYFNVNQNQVKMRITQALTFPPNEDFFNRAKLNPDFYGPFWILSTLVLLLGSVDNLSNYALSLFTNDDKWQGYFFKLQYFRYAIILLFSYSLIVPVGFFLYYKLVVGKINISLPQLICLYGYAFSCYLPALIVCLVPLQAIHWIAMIYACFNSGLFLYVNLKNHIQGIQSLALAGAIGAVQFMLSLILKFYFLALLKTS